MKKVLSFILSITIMVSAFPVNAFIVNAEDFENNTQTFSGYNKGYSDDKVGNESNDKKADSNIKAIGNNGGVKADSDKKEKDNEDVKADSDKNKKDNEDVKADSDKDEKDNEDVKAASDKDNKNNEDVKADYDKNEKDIKDQDQNKIEDDYIKVEDNLGDVTEDIQNQLMPKSMPKIELDNNEFKIEVEETIEINPEFQGEKKENRIKVKSIKVSDQKVISAVRDGYKVNIQALKAGETTITLTGENDESIVYTIIVVAKEEIIEFDETITVQVGETKNIGFKNIGLFPNIDVKNKDTEVVVAKVAGNIFTGRELKLEGKNAGIAYVELRVNQRITVYKVIVTPKTFAAKYFVLLPDQSINNLGKEQSWQYAPNDSIKIGNWNANTGIPGKLYSLKGVREEKSYGLRDYKRGFDSEYISNPDEMGGFNYNGIYYDLKDYQILWYKIVDQKDGYHVDGYIVDLPVQVQYQWKDKNVVHTETAHSDGKIHTGDNITLSSNSYTKFENGTQIFKGWKINVDGEEKQYVAGDSFKVMNSVIIEPIWENPVVPIQKVDINYKYGDIEFIDREGATVDAKYTAKTFTEAFKDVVLPQNEEFEGWRVAQGSEIIIDNLADDGSIIVNNNNKIVLEAVIRQIPTMNIEIYIGQTKTIKSYEIFNLIEIKSSEVKATLIDANSFSMVGIKKGTMQILLKQDNKIVGIYNVTVKPKPILAYKISFASSIKGAKDIPTQSQSVNEGSKIILPGNSPYFNGYKFIGWFDEVGNEVSNESIMPSKDLTLTAKFTKQSYILNFKAVDKDLQTQLKGVSNLPDDKTVEFDSSLKDIVKGLLPSKEGYKFIGWFDEAGNEVSNESIMPSKDLTLTAKFEKASYAVRYKSIDVMDMQTSLTDISNYPIKNKAIYGSSIKDIIHNVIPQKSGYRFLHWQYNGEDITNQTVPSKDIELVAHFERSLFTINYSYQGVDDKDKENIKNFPQSAKDILKETNIKIQVPTLDGYHFLGWFNQENKVKEITVNGDYNLTARFAKDSSVKIIFYSLDSGHSHKDTVVINNTNTFEGAKFPLQADYINNAAEEHLTDKNINNFRYVGDFHVVKDGKPVYYSKNINDSQIKSLNDIKLSSGDNNTVYVMYDQAHSITINYIQVDGETQNALGSYQIENVFNGSEVVMSDGFEKNAGFISSNYLMPKGYMLIKATLGDYKGGSAISNPFEINDQDTPINIFYAKDNERWKDFQTQNIYNANKDIQGSTSVSSESKVVNDTYKTVPILTKDNVRYVLSSVTVNGSNTQLVEGKISGIIDGNIKVVFTYDVDENGDNIPDKNQATFIFKSAEEKMGKVAGDITQIATNEIGETFKIVGSVTTIVEQGYKFANWTAESQGEILTFANFDAIKESEFLSDVTFTANWEAVLSGNSHRSNRHGGNSSNNITGGIPIEVIEIPDILTPLEQNPIITKANPYLPSNQNTDVVINIEDQTIPLWEKPEDIEDMELVDIEDETVPLASTPVSGWALVNLVITVFMVLSSILLLFKNKSMFKTLSIFPAITSILAFILTENISNPMVISDKWTLMMCIIAIIQAAVIILTNKCKKDEDTQSDAK